MQIAGEDRKDGRCWLFVLALIKSINDDESGSLGGFEWIDKELLHLRTEGFMSNIKALLHNVEQPLSETRILAGKLEGKGWEDLLKIAAVLGVPRTEETRPKLSVLGACLGEGLGDGRFSGPGQTVEPEDTLVPFFCKPVVNVLEDLRPCSPQTPMSVPTKIFGVRGGMQTIEKGEIR